MVAATKPRAPRRPPKGEKPEKRRRVATPEETITERDSNSALNEGAGEDNSATGAASVHSPSSTNAGSTNTGSTNDASTQNAAPMRQQDRSVAAKLAIKRRRRFTKLYLTVRRQAREVARWLTFPSARKTFANKAKHQLDRLSAKVPFKAMRRGARKRLWLRPRAVLRKAGIQWPRTALNKLGALIAKATPKGLYARALIIIIAPIVLLEGVIAFVFMERHWQAVTRRLSEATARDIAALIEVYQKYPGDNERSNLIDLANIQLKLGLSIAKGDKLPAPKSKPFFALLDRTLSNEIRKQIKHPFWIDTVGQSRHVEIRIKLDDAVLRFYAQRSQTFASNSHIFLLWMVGSSVVLLTVAILFLSNQIKPILRLSQAAEAFGKGRPVPKDFRPRGAREVRQAALAFIEMRDRITTHVEQRTVMLAGVSHDLRTILTRFKLELAMLGDEPEFEAMRSDVAEMQHMLEDYLAFSKGDGGESVAPTNMRELLEEILEDSTQFRTPIELKMRKRRKELVLTVKRNALKRAISNLISNAARFGNQIKITASSEEKWLRIDVEDDGPGISREVREDVFKPFLRLDHARNQDEANTGLGLSIARDIARSHGGDITLTTSPGLGGLRASFRLPL